MTRPFITLLFALAALGFVSADLSAQDPPPNIGPFAFDLHTTVPRFSHEAQLSDSRDMNQRELPGAGLGLHAGATVYVLRWKAVTFGLGGDATFARARSAAKRLTVNQIGRAVTERFMHVAPELSFNFGTGNGWSYISGGIGTATWSIVPDGSPALAADSEKLKTINYGGGARWFMKHHFAFSLDVRFYAIDPGTPELARPGSPRTTLLMIGGGISVK